MEITKVVKPFINRGANTFGNIVCVYICVYIYVYILLAVSVLRLDDIAVKTMQII